MNVKVSTINGQLQRTPTQWVVQCGYGTFPLAKRLQGQPEAGNAGDSVAAKVQFGEVIEYHFQNEVLGE